MIHDNLCLVCVLRRAHERVRSMTIDVDARHDVGKARIIIHFATIGTLVTDGHPREHARGMETVTTWELHDDGVALRGIAFAFDGDA